MKITNTLTRKKEIFRPLRGKKVQLFVCGPTVYDHPHLGHAKTYVQFDFIAKYLRHRGFDVTYLQNITDIDDKIIKRARETNEDPKKLARRFETSYDNDIKALGIDSIDQFARATEYIPQIIDQVERLQKAGIAYKTSDGIYYDIAKFPAYGTLARLDKREITKTRVDHNPEKRNIGDFVLWKKEKPGEPVWDSPFGRGRPGWHIEDTAITETIFGQQYDIHGGAEDLIFPHHEAEIAQMEALSGKPLVQYWMHTGFLLIDKEKMSKSLGNFLTIREALKQHPARVIRFFFLQTHYRLPMHFHAGVIEQAGQGLARIHDFTRALRRITKTGGADQAVATLVKKTITAAHQALDDDFHVAEALAAIFNLIAAVNKRMENLTQKSARHILKTIEQFDTFFGCLLPAEEHLEKNVAARIEERNAARARGDYKKADTIRADLIKEGILLEDTPHGTVWKKQ